MTELDPRLENLFTLRDLRIGRGEETPQFDAELIIKDRVVAHVSNAGRGGCSMFHWTAPFTRQWAETKLLPLAAKIASKKDPTFTELYTKSPSVALDSLIFDYVERESEKKRRQSAFRPRAATMSDALRDAIRDSAASAGSGDVSKDLFEKELREHILASFKPPAPAQRNSVPTQFKIGTKVLFGRDHGQKTLGKVVGINRKTVKVEALEDRGVHKAGTRFRVGRSLLTLA